MQIETKRLLLREMTENDYEALYAVLSDSDIMRHYPYTFDEARVRKWIKTNMERYRTFGFGLWAVCLKGSGEMIGDCGLSMQTVHGVIKPEIGYHIRKDMQRKGYAREAACAMRDWTFTHTPFETVYSYMKYTNEPSAKCAQSWGCVKVDEYADEVNEITYVYAVSKRAWAQNAEIRPLTDEEIPAALRLAWDVFCQYESPCYAPEGTLEFKKCLADKEYLSGIAYYGAFLSEKLAGFVGIRPGTRHICFFFVDGAYHRLGIGTRLFERVKADFSHQPITLNASPCGVPFYKALGFHAAMDELTTNGIRYTPMLWKEESTVFPIVRIHERPELLERAAQWFHEKWHVPLEAYQESLRDSMTRTVPRWYVCLDGEKIIAGMGVIENDFHDRKDLAPNVCAVYTEPFYRRMGLCARLLDFVERDMAKNGIKTLYLITGHTGLYERFGWKYLTMVQDEDSDNQSRMYIHTLEEPCEK